MDDWGLSFTNSGIERAEVVSYFLLKVCLGVSSFGARFGRRKRLAIFVLFPEAEFV